MMPIHYQAAENKVNETNVSGKLWLQSTTRLYWTYFAPKHILYASQ